MKNEIWKYKIGGGLQGLIPLLILLVLFGGISIWLYSRNNGAFIFTAFFVVIVLALIAYLFYRLMYVKVLIGENGIYHQTKPGNGKYHDYTAITEAWESSGKTLSSTASYCSYKAADGQVMKFPFLPCEADGIDYFLERINGEDQEVSGEGGKADEEETGEY